MQFTDWSVQARTVYTILTWTAQSVNCHIATKAMFYLLNELCNIKQEFALYVGKGYIQARIFSIV